MIEKHSDKDTFSSKTLSPKGDLANKLLSHPEESTDKKHWWFSKPLLVICGSLVAVVIFVNVAFKNPPALKEMSLPQRALFFTEQDHPDHAISIYEGLIQSDSNNIDLHYGLVTAHYSLPGSVENNKEKDDTSHTWRDDETIKSTYATLSKDHDSVRSDLGFYCLG